MNGKLKVLGGNMSGLLNELLNGWLKCLAQIGLWKWLKWQKWYKVELKEHFTLIHVALFEVSLHAPYLHSLVLE